ncbi:MAG: hypothetical protein ACD_23C00127G0002 [uncultured bacterium]|nr:MAG: hypothetical protein ACD_23C00127G0002 [uncultured bacterium]MDP3156558.1 hypothetical protein [Archangium sp.]MDP3438138.1 hypothetical protein [Azonexus sp.]MDP3638103.1 hypothetical protein [Azonexus sp.]
MSMAIPFDTLRFANRLEKAGLSREQASAFAEAQKEAFGEVLDSEIASKADILRVENKLETMELRLTIKIGAFMTIAVGLLAAVMKFLQ